MPGTLKRIGDTAMGQSHQHRRQTGKSEQHTPTVKVYLGCKWYRNSPKAFGAEHTQRGQYAQKTKNKRSASAQEQPGYENDQEVPADGGVAYSTKGIDRGGDYYQEKRGQ